MPYALVLHCIAPDAPITPMDLQGQKGLALFLEGLIEKQDAALAARLHAPRQSKPFTTAILPRQLPPGSESRRDRTRRHSWSAPEIRELQLRLTLLDDTLYAPVSQFFLQHLDSIPMLHLGQAHLAVARVLTTPESGEPWAGVARFTDLLAGSSETDTAWTIQFASPTVFKSGDADVPLPIPRLCFQSWLNSWEEHAPTPFFQDRAERLAFLSEIVERQVSVSYTHLHLAQDSLYFDGVRTREQGFVGTCRFAVRPTRVAPQPRQLLATLAAYSYYAGTGRKTTMGMGLTRPYR